MSCVNIHNTEFKELAKRLNISSGHLRNLQHLYQNLNNTDEFASDDWIRDHLHSEDNVITSDAQMQLWWNKYSDPVIVDNPNDYIADAGRFFNPESINKKELPDGRYECSVSTPVMKDSDGNLKTFNATPLKQEYKGKLIYAEAGTGKTTIADNVNVIDSDVILGKVLGVSRDTAGFFFNTLSALLKKEFGKKYREEILKLVKQGKTVITANSSFLESADVIIYNESAKETNRRTTEESRINKYDNIQYHEQTREKINATQNDAEKIQLSSKEHLADKLLTDSSFKLPLPNRLTTLDESINSFLESFGMTHLEAASYNGNVPLFDALHRAITTRNASEITDGVGYAIAFMMQFNPAMRKWLIHEQMKGLDFIIPESALEKMIQNPQDKIFTLPIGVAKLVGRKKVSLADIMNRFPGKDQAFRSIGKQIATEWRNAYTGEIGKTSLARRIWNVISDFFSKLFYGNRVNERKQLVRNIVESLGREDYSLIRGTRIKGNSTLLAELLDVEQAFKENPYEAEIIKKLSDAGIALTGSTAVRLLGTVYRPSSNPLHDIDFSTENGTTKAQLEEKLHSLFPNIQHVRTIIDTDNRKNSTETYISMDRKFTLESHPTVKDFQIIKDENGNEIGRMQLSKQELYLNDGVKGKLLDFFIGESPNIYGFRKLKIGDSEYLISNAENAMSKKVRWQRLKDIWDFAWYVPEKQRGSAKSKRFGLLTKLLHGDLAKIRANQWNLPLDVQQEVAQRIQDYMNSKLGEKYFDINVSKYFPDNKANIKDILTYISKKSSDKAIRVMAKSLLNRISDIKEIAEKEITYTGKREGARGYRRRSGEIEINGTALLGKNRSIAINNFESTVIHEIGHELTIDILEGLDFEAKRDLLLIFKDYRSLGVLYGIDLGYAGKDANEFVAEFLGRKAFREVLRALPSTRKGNIFQRMIEWFKNLLHINSNNTLLRDAESAIEKILDANEARFRDMQVRYDNEMQSIKQQAIADGTFMKAPNGKPTNLTERQWLQVRTKAFKNWFGDWESLAESKLNTLEILNEGGSINFEKLEELTDNYFKNADESLFARGRKTLRERKEHHIGENNTLEHLQNVVKSAQVADITEDLKQSLIVAAALHDIAKPFHGGHKHGFQSEQILDKIFKGKISGLAKFAIANHMMTLEEDKSFTAEDARRIVNDAVKRNLNVNDAIEVLIALHIADITRGRNLEDIDEYSNVPIKEVINGEIAEKRNLLKEAIAEITQNNSVSKIVDENGEPLVVYHNTNNKFTKFSKLRSFIGSLTGSALFGRGFYFSNYQGSSRQINMPVFLNVKNPAEGVMKSGNDGMIHDFGNGQVWYAAKDPNQIKSATTNTGEFSERSNDINYDSEYNSKLERKLNLALKDLVNNPLFAVYKNETTQRDGTFLEVRDKVTAEHSEFKILFDLIEKANPDVKIRIGGNEIKSDNGNLVPALYYAYKNEIWISNQADCNTIMHEMIHAGTLYQLSSATEEGKEFADYINRFMDHVRDYIEESGLDSSVLFPTSPSSPAPVYGFTDAIEFLAEVFTNDSLRELLENVPPMNNKEFKSMLQEIWHSIIDFLKGITNREVDKNALEQAESLTYSTLQALAMDINDYYTALRGEESQSEDLADEDMVELEDKEAMEKTPEEVLPNAEEMIKRSISDLEESLDDLPSIPENNPMSPGQLDMFRKHFSRPKLFKDFSSAYDYLLKGRNLLGKNACRMYYDAKVKGWVVASGFPQRAFPFQLNNRLWKQLSDYLSTLTGPRTTLFEAILDSYLKRGAFPVIKAVALLRIEHMRADGTKTSFVPLADANNGVIRINPLMVQGSTVRELTNMLLHECLHTFSIDIIDRGEEAPDTLSKEESDFYNEVSRLYDLSKTALGLRAASFYGMSNLHEFLSEAASNIEFQKELAQIKDPDNKLSVWDKIVNAFAKFFNKYFGIDIQGSVFEGVLKQINNVIDIKTLQAKIQEQRDSYNAYRGNKIISVDSVTPRLFNNSTEVIDFLMNTRFKFNRVNSILSEGGEYILHSYHGNYWLKKLKREENAEVVADYKLALDVLLDVILNLGFSLDAVSINNGIVTINQEVIEEGIREMLNSYSESQKEEWLEAQKEAEAYEYELALRLSDVSPELYNKVCNEEMDLTDAVSEYERINGSIWGSTHAMASLELLEQELREAASALLQPYFEGGGVWVTDLFPNAPEALAEKEEYNFMSGDRQNPLTPAEALEVLKRTDPSLIPLEFKNVGVEFIENPTTRTILENPKTVYILEGSEQSSLANQLFIDTSSLNVNDIKLSVDNAINRALEMARAGLKIALPISDLGKGLVKNSEAYKYLQEKLSSLKEEIYRMDVEQKNNALQYGLTPESMEAKQSEVITPSTQENTETNKQTKREKKESSVERGIKQIQAIKNNGRIHIPSLEIREVALSVATKISDMITYYQEHPEAIFDNFGKEIAEDKKGKEIEKLKGMSRLQTVNYIGADNLIKLANAELFVENELLDFEVNENLEDDTVTKAEVFSENFGGLMTLAADEIFELEGFTFLSTSEMSKATEGSQRDENSLDDDALRETEGNMQEHWQTESRTQDILSASLEVKREMHKLFDITDFDTEGNPIYRTDEYGIRKRKDATEAINKIVNWTLGMISYKDMLLKLQAQVENNPWLKPLVEKLTIVNGKENPNAVFLSQFFTTICKHHLNYTIVIKEKGVLKSIPANTNPLNKEVKGQLQALQLLGTHPILSNGKINLTSLDQLNKLSDQLRTQVTDKDNKQISDFNQVEVFNTIREISKYLGYEIPLSAIEEKTLSSLDITSIRSSLQYILKNLNANKNNSTYDITDYKKGIAGNVISFIKPFQDSLGLTRDNVTYDNGKTYLEYVTPSYMTKLVQKIANSTEEEFNKFIEEEYGQSEWFKNLDTEEWNIEILEWLANMTPEQRKLKFDHIVQLSFDGKNYMKDMLPELYVLAALAQYFTDRSLKSAVDEAFYKIPMLSNKPSFEFIKFKRFLGDFSAGTESTAKAAIVDGFMKIARQEIARIATFNLRALEGKQVAAISNYEKNGRKFVMLDFLQTERENGTELGKLLDKQISLAEDGEVLDIWDTSELVTLLRQSIIDNIDARVTETIENWKSSGLLENMNNIKGLDSSNLEGNLREFLWNDVYASANILELTITDPAMYKNAVDLQKRLAEIHAPGLRPNVLATDFKGERVSDGILRTFYLKDIEDFVSNICDNIAEVFDKKIAESKSDLERAGYELLKNSLVRPRTYNEDGSIKDNGGLFWNINVADALGFSSPTAYRKKALMFGKWSELAERTYEKIMLGEWNASDIQKAFQPLKPFVYSQVFKSSQVDAPITNLKIGVQNKNSEYLIMMADAMLQGHSTSRPNLLRALFRVMEDTAKINKKKGIDTIQFESAVKVGKMKTIDLSKFDSEEAAYQHMMAIIGDANKGYNSDYVFEIPFEDYSIQQEIPDHFKDHAQLFGSLVRYVLNSDLAYTNIDGSEAKYDFYDSRTGETRSLSAREYKKEFENIVAENISESVNILRTELRLDGSEQEQNIRIANLLREEIINSPRYGIELLDAVSLDEYGNFNFPLSDPIQSKRVEQLLYSIIKNRINKQKIAGGPLVQASNFGFSTELNIVFKSKDGGTLLTKAEYEKESANQKEALKDGNGKDVVMYRGYALTEDREAENLSETVGHTAIDYDDSLKGALYFTSSKEEAEDYAKARTDKSDETFMRNGEVVTQRNRHYTGDYAKVSAYKIKKDAKVVRFKDMRDYTLNGKGTNADVIILDKGTMWADNTEYVVINEDAVIRLAKKQTYKEYIQENQAGIAYYECFAPVYSKKLFAPFMNEKGEVDIKAIEQANPEMLKMLGYRIPTEAKYSVAPLKIVGFTPEISGDLIVLPNDITTLTGSDFDIDKFYVMLKEFKTEVNAVDTNKLKENVFNRYSNLTDQQKEGISNIIDRYMETLEVPKGSKIHSVIALEYLKLAYSYKEESEGVAGRNNTLFNMSYGLMTHETQANQVLNPGGFDALKKMGYLVEAARNTNIPFEVLEKMEIGLLADLALKSENLLFFGTNQKFYKQNVVAGAILGMFAVLKTAHSVFEGNLIGVKVADTLPMNNLLGFSLGDFKFGAFLNLDAQFNKKGELIGKILGSLVASAADAVKDPVLNLMNINNQTAPILTALIRCGMSFELASLFLSLKAITDIINKYNKKQLKEGWATFDSTVSERIEELKKNLGVNEENALWMSDITQEELIDGIKNYDDVREFKTLSALSKFMLLLNKIKGTTSVSRLNSITSAVGPLITNTIINGHKISNAFPEQGGSLYIGKDKVTLDRVFDDHPVLREFYLAYHIARDIFTRFPTNSFNFLSMAEDLGIVEREKKLLAFSDFYLSYLFFASHGEQSVKAKYGIPQNMGLEYFIDEFPSEFMNIRQNLPEELKDNLLLKSISLTANRKGHIYLQIQSLGVDKKLKNMLSAAWEDLHQANPELSAKLFLYNCYKTGTKFSPYTFLSLCPISVKAQMGNYALTYLNPILMGEAEKYSCMVDYIRNNPRSAQLYENCRIQHKEDGTVSVLLSSGEPLLGEDGIVDDATIAIRVKENDVEKLLVKDEYGKWRISSLLGNEGEYFEIGKKLNDMTLAEKRAEKRKEELSKSKENSEGVEAVTDVEVALEAEVENVDVVDGLEIDVEVADGYESVPVDIDVVDGMEVDVEVVDADYAETQQQAQIQALTAELGEVYGNLRQELFPNLAQNSGLTPAQQEQKIKDEMQNILQEITGDDVIDTSDIDTSAIEYC